MADGYDRFENEGGGGGSFVMGLLTGTVLGAGLGMLFAPKAGSELRNQLSEQAGNLKNQAGDWAERGRDMYNQAAERGRDMYSQAAEKGRDAYNQARDAVNRGVDEAQRYAREASSGATPTPATAGRMR
jgi:gas vesicle protein